MGNMILSGLYTLLSLYVTDPSPWIRQDGNSEQVNPVYLGATPREMELNNSKADRIEMYDFLKVRVEREAERIRKKLRLASLELEAWPVEDERGRLVWAYARYRKNAQSPWEWLPSNTLPEVDERRPSYFFPKDYRSWIKSERDAIYEDFLSLNSLYDKPLFSNCVFITRDGKKIIKAWVNPSDTTEFSEAVICKNLPQPSRFNEKPKTFVLKVTKNKVTFTDDIFWKSPASRSNMRLSKVTQKVEKVRPLQFTSDFGARYKLDVEILSGARKVSFPISNREIRFKRKNSATSNHQLIDMVEYLEERYKNLGIETWRQEFMWRGILQANMVAVIKGSLPEGQNRPVLMADHIDTAYSEDIFDETGQRVSVPGADDNVTATATLLRAAEALKDSKPLHDIWLVHLTGEEFPADDLGARKLVQKLLLDKTEISGLVLMDMIGYRKPTDPVFQVNAGESIESVRIAEIALAASRKASIGTEFEPVLRERFNPKSYLFNTDGLIFSNAGFPVVFFNEHLNFQDNFNRPHYHESTDTIDTLDWTYAETISKAAIETAHSLAQFQGTSCDSIL